LENSTGPAWKISLLSTSWRLVPSFSSKVASSIVSYLKVGRFTNTFDARLRFLFCARLPAKSKNTPTGSDRRRDAVVAFVTFGSLLGILAVWLRLAEGNVFWIYSILTTGFLLFMYAYTRGYKPLEDIGFRPRITVVIPAKNEERVIEDVVRTVFRSDYPSSEMEVIVVDDGSTDTTWDRLQQMRNNPLVLDRLVLIKHERNYGKRVALASAVAEAHGEIIVCIDSDSFVEHDAIKLLVQPFEDPAVMAVCGHGEAANKDRGLLPRLQHYWYAEAFRLLKGMESRLGIVSCCSGMLAAYRRTSILPITNAWVEEKIEGPARLDVMIHSQRGSRFTNKLIKSPGEDRILTAFALSGKNARSVYQSNAIVRTIVPETFRQFLKQQLRWNRAWIHGSLLAGRFMWKKSFVASLSFYLYQFLLVLSPAVIILWLIVRPFQGEWMGAIGLLAGTLYIGFLHGLNTWSYRKTSLASIPYRMAFVPVLFFLTLTVLLYAWATPWKMGWITRNGREPLTAPTNPQAISVDTVSA
jgi:hyaluronan synthase